MASLMNKVTQIVTFSFSSLQLNTFFQNAFVTERKELLDLHKSKWEGMMGSRADKEEEYMKKRDERVERYEKDLQDLRVKDAEEYNQLKIKLETDVQVGKESYMSWNCLPADDLDWRKIFAS